MRIIRYMLSPAEKLNAIMDVNFINTIQTDDNLRAEVLDSLARLKIDHTKLEKYTEGMQTTVFSLPKSSQELLKTTDGLLDAVKEVASKNNAVQRAKEKQADIIKEEILHTVAKELKLGDSIDEEVIGDKLTNLIVEDLKDKVPLAGRGKSRSEDVCERLVAMEYENMPYKEVPYTEIRNVNKYSDKFILEASNKLWEILPHNDIDGDDFYMYIVNTVPTLGVHCVDLGNITVILQFKGFLSPVNGADVKPIIHSVKVFNKDIKCLMFYCRTGNTELFNKVYKYIEEQVEKSLQ